MKKRLPPTAICVLSQLRECGHDAYLVGGAVRDLLLDREIHDIDIATSATPDEVREAFSSSRVIDTGILHGTVTVLFGDGSRAEITTFRAEGAYSDARHPDSVSFVRDPYADLARRDFTVGAMALSLEGELFDPFGGKEDLAAGVLRAVGDPQARFSEDALRILRALRFSSEYGFVLEEETRLAAHCCAERLLLVAKERLFSEFSRLLLGRDVCRVLLEEREIIARLVPEVRECFDFDQHSHHHCFDVYRHIAETVSAVEPVLELRLAAFYHDIGKPRVFTRDETGEGHFYSHAGESAFLAQKSLAAFGAPSKLREKVLFLVRQHVTVLRADEKGVRRALARYGEENLRALLKLKRADALAQSRAARAAHLEELSVFEAELSRFLQVSAAPSLKTLAVNGEDLLALGVPQGKTLGKILDALLTLVVDGEVENQFAKLLEKAREFWENGI